MENIIAKIEKLLATAQGNANENESIAAAAMAQKLMTKYNIEIADLDDNQKSQTINKEIFEGGRGKWRYQLAVIIAKNFRCKTYLIGKNIVFFGYETDAKIALETFKFLYKTGMKFAGRVYAEYQNVGKSTRGVMNTYYLGFVKGIEDVLNKQCVALMIVTPKEVEDQFEIITKTFAHTKSTSMKCNFDKSVYNKGVSDGHNMMNSKYIEA